MIDIMAEEKIKIIPTENPMGIKFGSILLSFIDFNLSILIRIKMIVITATRGGFSLK